MPDISLAATNGSAVNFAKLSGRTVVYAYPRTGEPGKAPPASWAAILGAMGCTPQSCAFRDHFAELRQHGAAQVYGRKSTGFRPRPRITSAKRRSA